MLRKGYRVHPVVHVTAVINRLIVIRVVELKVVEACKLAGTAGGTLKVCKVALNCRTYDIVNEVNVYVRGVLCGLGVNYLLDLVDTLTETVGCGVIPVEIGNVDLGSDLRASVSLVNAGVDSLSVGGVVTCKVSVTAGGKLTVVVVLGELENKGLVSPRIVDDSTATGHIITTLVAELVVVCVYVLVAIIGKGLAAVITLTVLVVIVVIALTGTGIATTRSKNRSTSKHHYQRKKQTNQFLFHVFSPLKISLPPDSRRQSYGEPSTVTS